MRKSVNLPKQPACAGTVLKHIRLFALVVLAASAGVAATATSASAAEPALYICHKAKGGHYSDQHCTTRVEEGGGGYEAEEYTGSGLSFSGKSSNLLFTNIELLSGGGGIDVQCNGISYSGKFVGSTLAKEVTLTLTGCGWNGSWQYPATSPGATNAGEIVFQTLLGEFGYIDALEHKVGLFVSPWSASYLAEFIMFGSAWRLHGTIPIAVTPTNEFTKHFVWQPKAENALHFQRAGNEWHEPWEPAGLTSEPLEITMATYGEVKG